MFALEIDDGMARITLHRPERRNAIARDGWASLAARIGEAEASAPRLLVVTGSGGAFCAGADLSDFPMALDAATEFRLAMRAALDRLRDIAIPAIARIDGACYGAGVALAMACDLRIATPASQFAIPPAKIGISYPQEDVHSLVALVGAGPAARLLWSGQGIDAAEALRIGLIEMVAEADECEAFLAAIRANGAESLVTLKRAVRLASAGVRQDEDQDARFDALLGGTELAQRLEAMRRK